MSVTIRVVAVALGHVILSQGLFAQTAIVVPARRATVVGNSPSLAPFGGNAGRFQQLIEGDAVCKTSATIDEIAFRPTMEFGSSIPFLGRRIPQLNIWLGSSRATRDTMSTTFAKNRGPRTVVYSGAYNLPTIQLGPIPAKWDIRIKLQNKFLYTRSSGNLLLEMEMPGVRSSLFINFVDAAVGTGGTNQSFGMSGRFNSGATMTAFSDHVSLRPGGTAYLGMTIVPPLPTIPPAFVMYGGSNSQYGALKLPLDLGPMGAAGNNLYVSLDLLLPVVLRRAPLNTHLIAQTGVSLPNNQNLIGVPIYGQAVVDHPASNPFGLVLSDAVEMRIGKYVPPVTRSLYATDSSAAAGKLGYGSGYDVGGPILRLSGSFN